MAIYRIGNRSLTEAEFEAEALLTWGFWIFVVVAGGLGFALWKLVPPDWPKLIRYALIVGPPIPVAWQAVRYTFFVRIFTYFGMFVGAFIGALVLVWHVL